MMQLKGLHHDDHLLVLSRLIKLKSRRS